MKPLSYSQKFRLKQLAIEPGRWGDSCTNPTASALETRGLAAYEWDRSKPYPWGRWCITEEGRKAV